MTLEDAIKTVRKLQAEADEGWPFEYDPAAVAAQATEALTAIDAHVQAARDPREEAKAVLHRIERREPFTPSVPTRRERERR
jgi:hypothetical protein